MSDTHETVREVSVSTNSTVAHPRGPIASPVDFDRYGDYVGKRDRPNRLIKDHSDGAFVRPPYPFRGRIGDTEFPAEPGRYHLFASYACPWASRSLIVRKLKGLDDVIGVSIVDPVRDGRGWAFREGPGQTGDTSGNGFTFLSEAYEATEPGYPGHLSVPVLWDNKTHRIVSNHFPDISLDIGSQFNQWATNPELNLYPDNLRQEIDVLADDIYTNLNNGVYRAGFAQSQAPYEKAVHDVFATLDKLEGRLSEGGPFLFGDQLTEADVRLWVTLVRFDVVYYVHFKVNIRHLTDYPALWAYARRLYAIPAFRETTNFDHIKRHYYTTHPLNNPLRIVPVGPEINWNLTDQD